MYQGLIAFTADRRSYSCHILGRVTPLQQTSGILITFCHKLDGFTYLN